MKTKLKFLPSILALSTSAILFLSSCEKQGDITNNDLITKAKPTENINDLKLEQINNALDSAAYTLAISLNDVGIRKTIKEEVGKKFDGDYDVLFKDIADLKVNNDNNLISAIANSYINEQSKKTLKNESTVEDIKNHFSKWQSAIPKFQIAVPIQFESWNAETYIPLVGYIEYNSTNENPIYIKAYDVEGNSYQLDALIAPEFPVIILGINERTDENGTVIYREPEETIDITPSFKSESTSDRVVLKRMKVINLEEAWSRGDAEVCLRVVGMNVTVTLAPIFSNEISVDRDYEGVWRNRNWEMFQWSFSDEYVIFYWYEDDGSLIMESNYISYDGFLYEFYNSFGDDQMGWNAVYLEDLTSSSYNNPVIYNTTDGDVRYSIYTH